MENINLLLCNAYNILALDIKASKKEIFNQAKRLFQQIKFEDQTKQNSDLNFNTIRTEKNINEALQLLSVPAKKIKEYFFWFENLDEIDKQFLNLVKLNEYNAALNFLKDHIQKNKTSDLLKEKNLGILNIFLLSQGRADLLDETLILWKEILSSKKFWNNFIKNYKLHDDLETSDEIINSFQENVESFLADYFTDLAVTNNNPIFISGFFNYFNNKGNLINTLIVNPSLELINKKIGVLNSIKVSEDKVFSEGEKITINDCISSIKKEFDELKKYGLFEESEIKAIRDNTAEAITLITLDLHNDLRETDNAILYCKIASEICGTLSLKNKILKDIKILEKIKSNDEITTPIYEIIEKQNYNLALGQINRELDKATDNDLIKSLNALKKIAVTSKILQLHKTVNDKMERSLWQDAKNLSLEIINLLFISQEVFNFDFAKIEEIINKFKNSLLSNQYNIYFNFSDNIDAQRKAIVKAVGENFPNSYEGPVIISYFDAKINTVIADIIIKREEVNRSRRKRNILLGIFIPIAVIAIFSLIIFLSIKNDTADENKQTNQTNVTIIERENFTQETYVKDETEEEIQFIKKVGNIIGEVDSAISSSNYYGDDLEGFINSERSFLRRLESLDGELNNLSYPMSCASYRNNLCSIFDDICVYERRLINALEELDDVGYDSNLRKLNNSLETFINSYNSMITYLENKYN